MQEPLSGHWQLNQEPHIKLKHQAIHHVLRLFCGAFALTTIVSAIINNGNNRTAISTVYVAITFICYPNYIFYWKEYDINSS